MTEETTYYKILKRYNRYSCMITNSNFVVHYPVNMWVRPKVKGTKLLIFEDYKSAIHFINTKHYTDYIIVPCYARYIVKVTTVKSISYLHSDIPLDLQKFWKKRKNNGYFYQHSFSLNNFYYFQAAPAGTLGASMVKCLR